jgi:hypothetical protein
MAEPRLERQRLGQWGTRFTLALSVLTSGCDRRNDPAADGRAADLEKAQTEIALRPLEPVAAPNLGPVPTGNPDQPPTNNRAPSAAKPKSAPLRDKPKAGVEPRTKVRAAKTSSERKRPAKPAESPK